MAATKATTKKAVAKEKEATSKEERYVYAVGRRKTAVAQVRYYPETKTESVKILVNDRDFDQYFNTAAQREAVLAPLKAAARDKAAMITVHVNGGGLSGQADAVKLGIARALVGHDELLRTILRAQNLLTRDPRAVERKKPGLHKARRAPQWAKR
ncbi:MAG: 30S ribosomal protein S9 [Candidatus Moraniibacteriota bacterium]|nr:MAG: 30S ribosomal protein S9 [Candidatus Moranbacteria bacterium]